ncbi:hypothetical protein [Carboxylicivirga linearis]|uniref:hypothetical protein n=1 Tax=Carboxylicivirga linearis TaxID=1628157 RepID=UPI001BAE1EF8|nr:hypothetical protein [Carboxylicivirga linearis]
MILTLALLLASCAVEHKVIPELSIGNIDTYQFNETDSLYYGYFKDLLKESCNKRLQRWAKRKHYTFVGFKVTNASLEFTKGYQLKYYYKGQKITPVRNQWVAHKARQKSKASGWLALPFTLIEKAIWPPEEVYDEYGFSQNDESTISSQIAEDDNKVRKQANKDLAEDLVSHEISDKVLHTGVPVYGIMVLEGDIDLAQLEIGK